MSAADAHSSAPGKPGAPAPEPSRRWTRSEFRQTFEAVRGRPVAVESLAVLGIGRTRPDLVLRELAGLSTAQTLDEVKDVVLKAHDALKMLGPYEAVEVTIDDSVTGRADACRVVVNLHERRWWHATVGTYVDGAEGSVELKLGTTGVAGLAERAELDVRVGSQTSTEAALSLGRSRLGGRPLDGNAVVQQASRNCEAASSYVERLRGVTLGVGSQDGRHAVAYELAWRTLEDPSRRASLPVRQQLGDHLKSAVSYALQRDTRELDANGIFDAGSLLKASAELAGVGLDAHLLRFAKAQAAAAVALPLGVAGAALTLRGELGVLLPWGRGFASQPTCISDRFFIGGLPTNLRGFAFKGAGPCAPRRKERVEGEPVAPKRDALGGDLMCSLLAAVSFPLPFEAPRALGIHGHVFVNGGSAELLAGTGRPMREAAHEFVRAFRWTAGVGLVWNTTLGRLEVNLCRVLARRPTDVARQGVEVGFAPQFN